MTVWSENCSCQKYHFFAFLLFLSLYFDVWMYGVMGMCVRWQMIFHLGMYLIIIFYSHCLLVLSTLLICWIRPALLGLCWLNRSGLRARSLVKLLTCEFFLFSWGHFCFWLAISSLSRAQEYNTLFLLRYPSGNRCDLSCKLHWDRVLVLLLFSCYEFIRAGSSVLCFSFRLLCL